MSISYESRRPALTCTLLLTAMMACSKPVEHDPSREAARQADLLLQVECGDVAALRSLDLAIHYGHTAVPNGEHWADVYASVEARLLLSFHALMREGERHAALGDRDQALACFDGALAVAELVRPGNTDEIHASALAAGKLLLSAERGQEAFFAASRAARVEREIAESKANRTVSFEARALHAQLRARFGVK